MVFVSLTAASAQDQAELSLDEHLRRADEVLQEAQTHQISAAKKAWQVIEAAKALETEGDAARAVFYFEKGLQLAPWNMEGHLSYALALQKLGEPGKAAASIEFVQRHAETDDWYNAAGKANHQPPLEPAQRWDGKSDVPAVVFIRVGKVSEILLREAGDKLEATLGIPVRTHKEMVVPPQPDRSAFDRWIEHHIIPSIDWKHPAARPLLDEIGVDDPKKSSGTALIGAIIRRLTLEGDVKRATELAQAIEHYKKWDSQWLADKLESYALEAVGETASASGPVIFIGITALDICSSDSNFLFGVAAIGGRQGLVSHLRFSAEFNGEPPDRRRLVSRLHKQLLSTIGNALDVPRPLDPTSARSYPASLAEHDAKSEFMSEACIAGFERALGKKLPTAARPSTDAR